MEALGRRVLLPETWGQGKGSDLGPIFNRTCSELAQRLPGPLPAMQECLPELGDSKDDLRRRSPGAAPPPGSLDDDDVSQEIATTQRLAGERSREAEIERNRSRALQKALTQTQGDLRRTCGALSSLQYGLEGWRREALINAQGGEASKVVKMLSRLPIPPRLDQLLEGDLNGKGLAQHGTSPTHPDRTGPAHLGGSPHGASSHQSPSGGGGYLGGGTTTTLDALPTTEQGQIGRPAPNPHYEGEEGEVWTRHRLEDEDPKMRTFKTRAGNPFSSRPPSATVGDVPLSHLDDEERQPLRELFFTSGPGAEAGAGNYGHYGQEDWQDQSYQYPVDQWEQPQQPGYHVPADGAGFSPRPGEVVSSPPLAGGSAADAHFETYGHAGDGAVHHHGGLLVGLPTTHDPYADHKP